MVSWMMTIKAVLISSGVASMALLLKVSVPVAVDFSVSQAPVLWSSLLSWLKPPYLYFVTNGIIITIVASAKYYRSTGREEEDEIVYGDGYKIQTEELIVNHQAPPRIMEVKDLATGEHFGFVVPNPEVEEVELESVTAVVYDDDEEEAEAVMAVVYDDEEEAVEEKITDPVAMVEVEHVDEIEEKLKSVIMVENSDLVESDFKLAPPPMTKSENLPPTEKPLVSSRFGHRKVVKASQEGGRVLKVTKPKKNETLENTWKMITEGKSTPLTRQLYRRSDTFSRDQAKPVYKKSETFRDRTNYYQSPETGKVRKEPSLGQDELNRRVEEFIKKINEEMRMQRMESLRQYKEITSRGV